MSWEHYWRLNVTEPSGGQLLMGMHECACILYRSVHTGHEIVFSYYYYLFSQALSMPMLKIAMAISVPASNDSHIVKTHLAPVATINCVARTSIVHGRPKSPIKQPHHKPPYTACRLHVEHGNPRREEFLSS